MRQRLASVLLLAALLLTACGLDAQGEPPPPEPPPPQEEPPPVQEPPPAEEPPPVEEPPPDSILDPAAMLRLVNEARAAGATCGDNLYQPAPPMQLESRLVRAAQAHSDDMAATGNMSHQGSDGSWPDERVTRTGYRYSFVGENIAMGYFSAERVMAGWLESPGHCANIMNSRYSELGVARSDRFWTMVLAHPR